MLPHAPGLALHRTLAVVALVVTAVSAVGIAARATYGAHTTADEPQYLLSAISLYEDRDLDIADEIAQERYESFHEVRLDPQTRELEDGRRVSPHDPLLPALLALPMGVGGWVLAKLALAVSAGALAAALVWVAVRRFAVPQGVAAVTVLAFGVAAPIAAYGTQVYPEVPAALAVTVAIGALTGRLDGRGLAVLGVALVALPWLAVKYAPVVAALGLLAVVRMGRERRWSALGWFVGLTGAAAVAYLVVHQVVYEGWTVYAAGDHFAETGELSVVGTDPDFVGRSRRVLGLVVDRGFGLAAWAPVFLLAVPALACLVRVRPRRWEALVLPLAAGWLNATFVALTMHGWWWPGRQVVVVVPCIVLVVAWWAARVRPAIAWVAGLGVVGALSWLWLAIEASVGRLTLIVDFERTANPLYRVWRLVLPDGRDVGPLTEALTAVWWAVVVALAIVGWRSGGADEDPPAGELADADGEAVDLDGRRSVGR